jgi:hypothetical protein
LLCVFAILAAMDIMYLTHIVGYVALMVVLGILAVIYMTCDKTICILNTAALLIILWFASGNSVFLVLMGTVLALSAGVLTIAIRKKSTKTSAVLIVGLTVSVGSVAMAALLYVARGNSLAISDLFEKLNSVFDSIKVLTADLIRESVESLSAEMLAYYAKYDITKELLLETTVMTMEAFLDMVQLLLPGCFLFFVQMMAYISIVSFEKIARLVRCEVILPEARWILYPTQVSCVVYILVTSAYLLAGFFSPSSTFAILTMNFWIALMPVMIACGFTGLIMRLKHPRLRKSMIFILILFAAGCLFITETALSFGLFMLTFMGAQDVSFARTAEAAERKNRDSGR